MPITEFCGISFQKLQWNFYIQKLTEEIMIVPAHTHTHSHTLQLFRKLPEETVRKKRAFQNYHTL